MRTFLQRTLFVLLALLATGGDGLRAQWTVVAPSLCDVSVGSGAMCFHDGIVWIADNNSLFLSSDSGITWTSKNLPDPVNQYSEVEFINSTDGILSSYYATWTTTDAGTTWHQLLPGYVYTDAFSACFLGGFDSIAIANDAAPQGITLDGGNTWRSSAPVRCPLSVRYRSGTIYEFGGDTTGGFIFSSNDFGLTWQQGKTGIDFDSYSFAIDSCDPNRIYLSHEDDAWQTDQFSKILLTTDRGDTWQTIIKQPLPFFSGSIAEGNTAIYCQTMANGIFRSTDKGMTWSYIGGPSVTFDTRVIAAINDNIVLGIDDEGNVWRTTNSGGDSVRASSGLTAVPTTLFNADTIQCDSLTRSITLMQTGCPLLSVTGISIVGFDSSSFKVNSVSNDSISVTLNGRTPGEKHAQLVLSISDGLADTIALSGHVTIPPNALSASPATLFSSDTIYCDSISRSVSFSKTGCAPPSVSSWLVIGIDSASFKASNLTDDSILVTLFCVKQGSQEAQLVLLLNNGISDTVSVSGYVYLPSALNLTTQNVQTNTLGATISVPVTITGLNQTENVNLVLHYDSVLQYQGSFDAANNKLDIPGQQWPGRSELNILQAQSGVVAGYARFTVFADTGAKPQVTFDSLDVLSATSPCEYTLPSPITSIITPPSGCGTEILSQFLQDSTIPTFSIRPNPTMGDVELTSSMNLGEAEVEIYDVLGAQRAELTVTLSNDAPAIFSLPDAAGIYYLRINSIAGVRSMSVVVAK